MRWRIALARIFYGIGCWWIFALIGIFFGAAVAR